MAVQTYERTAIVRHKAPPRRRAQHAAPPSRLAVGLATGVAIVAAFGSVACGYLTIGSGVSRAAGPAPALLAAERACQEAVRAAFAPDSAQPDFFQASMDDVNVWDSHPAGAAVVVSGDVEWTLTAGVFGPHLQTNRYTCTAKTQDGRIVTSVT
ncbi:hypothetical protein [Actinoplanes palleronii]|uniref:Uncharacterized protein n=1 Tax=Actinoplanes palleronii TaxID=113570 RepID=A0ABQ4BN91_9ACTN|nr:hypothetical protein [Actinoplanes palleronii]GIE72151.1 hypothetical protein Apa02nite_082590 [Actinoplanes palleronii]